MLTNLDLAEIQADIWAQYRDDPDRTRLDEWEKAELTAWVTGNKSEDWDALNWGARDILEAAFNRTAEEYPPDHPGDCEFCQCDDSDHQVNWRIELPNMAYHMCGSCYGAFIAGWEAALPNSTDYPPTYTLRSGEI